MASSSVYYVRRDQKIAGPFTAARLKELAAAGKITPTDHLARSPDGPWTPAARSRLFRRAADAGRPPTIDDRASPQPPIVPIVEPAHGAAVDAVEARTSLAHVARKTRSVLVITWRPLWAIAVYTGRAMAERSRRRHELKLARLQVARHAPPDPTPAAALPPHITFAPQLVQSTMVRASQTTRGGSGCGCSGCASSLLLVLLALIALAVWTAGQPPATP